MRTIYIDSDFKCHANNPDGTFRECDTDFFDGMCDAVVEGHRYIPVGESWAREDGEVFRGEAISPCRDSRVNAAYQEEYNRSGRLLHELIGGVEDVQYE